MNLLKTDPHTYPSKKTPYIMKNNVSTELKVVHITKLTVHPPPSSSCSQETFTLLLPSGEIVYTPDEFHPCVKPSSQSIGGLEKNNRNMS